MNSTRISLHINAPRPRVYAALTDADAIAQWKVPDGMTADVHSFEPVEGGAIRVTLTYQDPSHEGKSNALPE